MRNYRVPYYSLICKQQSPYYYELKFIKRTWRAKAKSHTYVTNTILYISNTRVQVKNMFAHLHEAKHFLGNIAAHSDPARNGIISQLRVSMTSARFSLEMHVLVCPGCPVLMTIRPFRMSVDCKVASNFIIYIIVTRS